MTRMSREGCTSGVQARQQHSGSQPSTEAAKPVSSLLAGYHSQELHQQALPSHLGQHIAVAPSGQRQALGQQRPLQGQQPGHLQRHSVQQQTSRDQLQGREPRSLSQVQQLQGGDQGSLSNLRQLQGLAGGVQEASAGS